MRYKQIVNLKGHHWGKIRKVIVIAFFSEDFNRERNIR